MDFFYDNQIRRYLLQFMRIFSDIKVRIGPDANGLYSIQPVPILYGDPSWMVAQIVKGVSENTLLPSPLFSAWIENIKHVPTRRQDTQYVGKVSTIEREFDTLTQQYTENPGIRQDVERYMPVPYDLYFRLDVWTPNVTIKLQILEQICMIFNPSLQLQQNTNLLDWTSIFEIWLEDVIWSNRSIPQGTEDIKDILSFKFKIQGWINPPAKLKRSGIVAEIVTRVFDETNITALEKQINLDIYDPVQALAGGIPLQIVTTEGNYQISVSHSPAGDVIKLLNENGTVSPPLNWNELIQIYGQISPNITKLRLKLDPNLDVSTSDIIGTIIVDTSDPTILYFTPDIDTLPKNNLPPITDIIDPTEVTPGNGLPPVAIGQRYLLTSYDSDGEEPAIPPGVKTSPWGDTIVAYPNDIIEFNGTTWSVIFSAKNSNGKYYTVNNSNSSQYMFDGISWTYSYYGLYAPGYWRIDNIIQAPNGTTINSYE